MRIRGSRRIAALALTCACALSLHAQEKTGPSITVHVSYTGAGTVDETHKIYVALWDSPKFMQSDMNPVAVKSTTSKNGEVTFSDVAKTPAYVSVAFDPTGKWTAQSAPPTGSSLGMYSKTPGTPAAIEPAAGHSADVQVTFDDSVKAK